MRVILNVAALDPNLTSAERDAVEAYLEPRVRAAAVDGAEADGLDDDHVDVTFVFEPGNPAFIIEPSWHIGADWTRRLIDHVTDEWWTPLTTS